jgi:hypothetical protein
MNFRALIATASCAVLLLLLPLLRAARTATGSLSLRVVEKPPVASSLLPSPAVLLPSSLLLPLSSSSSHALRAGGSGDGCCALIEICSTGK